jgi:hypothetical protein
MAALAVQRPGASRPTAIAPGLSFGGGHQSKLNRGEFQFSISAAAI